jgi:hypothetical protein
MFVISFEGDLADVCHRRRTNTYGDVGETIPLAFNAPLIAERLSKRNAIVWIGDSLEAALDWLSERFQCDAEDTDSSWPLPDPEDDRLLIWQLDDQARVCWHCSGWHYNGDAGDLDVTGLAQGCLPGQRVSLHEAAMDEDFHPSVLASEANSQRW